MEHGNLEQSARESGKVPGPHCESLSAFADYLCRQGKQPATIESYRLDAQTFLTWLAERDIAPQQAKPDYLIEFQDVMIDLGMRRNSLRRRVIGIRQYFRFLEDQGNLESTPFDALPIPMRLEKQAPQLRLAAIESLIRCAERQVYPIKAARDALILHLLAFEGLKANELIHLSAKDLKRDDELTAIHIGGSHHRSIILSAGTAAAATIYLSELTAGQSSGRHFNAPQGAERLLIGFKGRGQSAAHDRLTRHGLKFLLYELGTTAGIAFLNTENLRHFAISYLRSRGLSPEEIMRHLGLRQLGVIAQHFRGPALADQGGLPSATLAQAVAPPAEEAFSLC